MSAVGLAAIPWVFQDSDLAKIWQWRTEHFEVTVTAEPNAFFWELGDWMVPNQGAARFLAEGRARDWAEVENGVREAVGKSYPPTLGYGVYAGSLATTFLLATGTRVDLGEFSGQRAVVTVRLPSGGEQSLVGFVRVRHYELHLETSSGSAIKVQPSHVVQIVREGGGGVSQAKAAYSGMGRTFHGSVVRGCTGRPGFLPGSVDHTGGVCPIHEDAKPVYHSVAPLH